MLASRFTRQSPNLRSRDPLTDDQIRAVALRSMPMPLMRAGPNATPTSQRRRSWTVCAKKGFSHSW